MTDFRDKGGEVLGPGDIVVYAVKNGDRVTLRYGKVLGPNKNGGIKVWGVEDAWIDYEGKTIREAKLMSKPGVLGFSERVHKIPALLVPIEIMRLFVEVKS